MPRHKKHRDNLGDSSSSGSIMDDTDHEVSCLTDRAFRSLCVGEEEALNGLQHICSPNKAQQFTKFNQVSLNYTNSRSNFLNSLSMRANEQAKWTSTFQQLPKCLKEEWKGIKNKPSVVEFCVPDLRKHSQRSKVSSLIKTFDNIENECPLISTPGTQRPHTKSFQKSKGHPIGGREDSSALNTHTGVSEFSDACQDNYWLDEKYDAQKRRISKNWVHPPQNSFSPSEVSTSQMPRPAHHSGTKKSMKNQSDEGKEPTNKISFLHSEHSAFKSWSDHHKNRFEKLDCTEWTAETVVIQECDVCQPLKPIHTSVYEDSHSKSIKERSQDHILESNLSSLSLASLHRPKALSIVHENEVCAEALSPASSKSSSLISNHNTMVKKQVKKLPIEALPLLPLSSTSSHIAIARSPENDFKVEALPSFKVKIKERDILAIAPPALPMSTASSNMAVTNDQEKELLIDSSTPLKTSSTTNHRTMANTWEKDILMEDPCLPSNQRNIGKGLVQDCTVETPPFLPVPYDPSHRLVAKGQEKELLSAARPSLLVSYSPSHRVMSSNQEKELHVGTSSSSQVVLTSNVINQEHVSPIEDVSMSNKNIDRITNYKKGVCMKSSSSGGLSSCSSTKTVKKWEAAGAPSSPLLAPVRRRALATGQEREILMETASSLSPKSRRTLFPKQETVLLAGTGTRASISQAKQSVMSSQKMSTPMDVCVLSVPESERKTETTQNEEVLVDTSSPLQAPCVSNTTDTNHRTDDRSGVPSTPNVALESHKVKPLKAIFKQEGDTPKEDVSLSTHRNGSLIKKQDNIIVMGSSSPSSESHEDVCILSTDEKHELGNVCPPWRRGKVKMRIQQENLNENAKARGNQFVPRRPATATETVQVTKQEGPARTASPSFSITKLLTPIIRRKHITEAIDDDLELISPPPVDIPGGREHEAKASADIISRDNYRSKASSLLFNIKDVRKRVKSTYSTSPLLKNTDEQISQRENGRLEKERGNHGKMDKGRIEKRKKETENVPKAIKCETLERDNQWKEAMRGEKQVMEIQGKDNLEVEKQEREKLEHDKLEKERLKREESERKKLERERLQRDKLERLEMKKLESEQLEREKQEREKLERDKQERERMEREKLERMKFELENNEREKIQKKKLEKLERERIIREKIEGENIERQEREREMRDKMRKEKIEKEKIENERLERKTLESQRLKRETLERERLERDKLERERLGREILERERLEHEKLEREKIAKERKEMEKQERKKLEEKLQREFLENIEKEEIEKKKMENDELERETIKKIEMEKIEKERFEREELAREKMQQLENEKIVVMEGEKLETEQLERGNIETIKRDEVEKKKIEKEKQERERMVKKEKERLEREELAREKMEKIEKERNENERLEREKLEMEKLERESMAKIAWEEIEKVKMEKEKLERERMKQSEKEKNERQKLERENIEKNERETNERDMDEKEGMEMEKKDKENVESEKERIERENIENARLEKERMGKLKKERLKKQERETTENDKPGGENIQRENIEREDPKLEKIMLNNLERLNMKNENLEKNRTEVENNTGTKKLGRIERESIKRQLIGEEIIQKDESETKQKTKEEIDSQRKENEHTESVVEDQESEQTMMEKENSQSGIFPLQDESSQAPARKENPSHVLDVHNFRTFERQNKVELNGHLADNYLTLSSPQTVQENIISQTDERPKAEVTLADKDPMKERAEHDEELVQVDQQQEGRSNPSLYLPHNESVCSQGEAQANRSDEHMSPHWKLQDCVTERSVEQPRRHVSQTVPSSPLSPKAGSSYKEERASSDQSNGESANGRAATSKAPYVYFDEPQSEEQRPGSIERHDERERPTEGKGGSTLTDKEVGKEELQYYSLSTSSPGVEERSDRQQKAPGWEGKNGHVKQNEESNIIKGLSLERQENKSASKGENHRSSFFKPNLFTIKNNRGKSSSVTKAVKLPLPRSMSEDCLLSCQWEGGLRSPDTVAKERLGLRELRDTQKIPEKTADQTTKQRPSKQTHTKTNGFGFGSAFRRIMKQLSQPESTAIRSLTQDKRSYSLPRLLDVDADDGHFFSRTGKSKESGGRPMVRDNAAFIHARSISFESCTSPEDALFYSAQSSESDYRMEPSADYSMSDRRNSPSPKPVNVEMGGCLVVSPEFQDCLHSPASAGSEELSQFVDSAEYPEEITFSAATSPFSESIACSLVSENTTSSGFATVMSPSVGYPIPILTEESTIEESDTSMATAPLDHGGNLDHKNMTLEKAESTKEGKERSNLLCSIDKMTAKPPTVPPKTEKALRRAKRLASKRRKSEVQQKKTHADGSEIVLTVPSPMVPSPAHLAMTSSLPTMVHHELEFPSTDPCNLRHSGAKSLTSTSQHPVTQRKLLQDPDSGQYFVVDVPVQVQVKTFYDPDTGKYIQVSVPSTDGNLTQASSVEVLNTPYVLYPGFLPIAVSALPPTRSSSQLSGPPTLMQEPLKTEKREEPWNRHLAAMDFGEKHPYIEPVCDSYSSSPYSIDTDSYDSRRHDIISMGDLDDFAVEGIS
ncbi:cardiac-enriched FHL2-interacting protein [Ambystoma mexicanum]|uniref:cardiac-enriched FHL2-interacting protein n=1 Tax=Ambystoma mexicanum TaxID=8296 RepID=UPI0037E7403F